MIANHQETAVAGTVRYEPGDVVRQHAMISGIERGHFLRQWVGARENRGKRVGNRHQGHGRNSLKFQT